MKTTKTVTKHRDPDNKAQNHSSNNPPPLGYLVKEEVAERLRKKPRTIERWMRRGLIPYIKIGKGRRATLLFSWPDIQAQLSSRFGCGMPSALR